MGDDDAYRLRHRLLGHVVGVRHARQHHHRHDPLSDRLAGVAVAPDGGTAYVAGGASLVNGTITALDTATNEVAATIPVDPYPADVAVSPSGDHVYVTHAYGSAVTVIETSTNGVSTVPIGGRRATGMALSPDGNTLYVADAAPRVIAIDTSDPNAPTTTTIPLPDVVEDVAIAPDGDTLYVIAWQSTYGVIAIDTHTHERTTIASPESPAEIAVAPDGATVYTANATEPGTVTAIDTATRDTTTFPSGAVDQTPLGIAVTPDSGSVYVAHFGSTGSVSAIDTATGDTTTIPVGDRATGIAITPNQPPTAAFSATEQPAGTPTTFDATASTDREGGVASYFWEFGDGSTDTTTTPTTSHAYANAGQYTVKLTVTDDEGCSTTFVFTGRTASCNGSETAATASHQITVAAPEPSADDLLHELRAYVEGLAPGTSLVDKAQAALDAYEAHDIAATCTTLTELTRLATAQTGKKLTAQQATTITTYVDRIRQLIGC